MMKPFFACLLIALMALAPMQSFATGGAPGPQEPYSKTDPAEEGKIEAPTGAGGTDTKENCRDKYDGKMLAVIVPCVRDTMQVLAEEMTDQFAGVVWAMTIAFITLVVTIFGIQVTTQEVDIKKDGFTLLFKIGVVLMMVSNFGGFIPDTFAILVELCQIVSDTLGGTMASMEMDCSGFEGEQPWNYYDCAVGYLFGFAPETFVGLSLVSVVPAALQSGQFGVMIFMAGVAGFLFILRLIIRVTYIYLMAVVALAFMIVVSPLFIPLLLTKRTEQYFSRWLHGFMSLIGQPVIVVAFMTFAIAVLDKALNDEEFGILKIAKSEDIKEWQSQASNSNSQGVVGDCGNYFQQAGDDLEKTEDDKQYNIVTPFLSCAAQMGLGSSQWTLDFGSDEATVTQKLFFGLITLVIISYLLLLLVNTLMSIAAIMFGGAFYLREAADNNPLEAGLNTMESSMRGNWSNSMKSISSGNSTAGQGLANFAGSGGSAAIQGFMAGTGEALGMRR